MSNVPKIIPSLTGGVSQQPPSLRFPGQVSESVNSWLSLVDGAAKRPPTTHIAKIITDVEADSAFHVIERDGADYFLALSAKGPTTSKPGVRVFDISDGSEELVVPPNPSDATVADELEISTHYFSDAPNNYVGDWRQPGLTATWTTAVGADEAGAAASAEDAPLTGQGKAVELWDITPPGGNGIWTHRTDTAFGEKSTILSVYVKEKDTLTSFSLTMRNTTKGETYTAGWYWSASVPMSSTATFGTQHEESIGSGWYRISYVIDPDESGSGPDVGDRIEFIQIEVAGSSTAVRDYFWGVSLHHRDDVADATKDKPIESGFGPFRFLTIADSTQILNTAWETRLGAPATQTRNAWLQSIPTPYLDLATIDVAASPPLAAQQFEVRATNASGSYILQTSGHITDAAVEGAIQTAILAWDDSFIDTTVSGGVVTMRSHSELSDVSVSVFPGLSSDITLAQWDPSVYFTVLLGEDGTTYDWSLTNSSGSFGGAGILSGTTVKADIAKLIADEIAAADLSLAETTNAGPVITVVSDSPITAYDFSDDSANEATTESLTPPVADVLYIAIQQAVSGEEYRWTITTGDGTFSGEVTASTSETQDVAGEVLVDILAAHSSFAGSTLIDSVVEVRCTSTMTEFSVSDDSGDTLMFAFKDDVETITDLPVTLRDGYRVRVNPDPTTTVEDYYIKFITDGPANTGAGRWVESTDWGTVQGFDPGSMSQQLNLAIDDDVGTATGTPFGTYFIYKPATWVDREVGNDETNEPPSFIGKPLKEIFFHANRLGFLAEGSMVLSEAGVYFNFWRTTSLAVPDSDLVDIGANEPKLATLRAAGTVDKQLVVSSDFAQFALEPGPVTPSTATLNQVASYPVSDLRPVSLGRSLLFPTFGSEWAGTIDFFQVDENVFSDEELTQGVPKYIGGEITQGSAYPRESVAVFKATDANTLYVFKYAWQGNQRVQAAWSKWEFGPGATVRHADFIEGKLILAIERDGDLFLESMDVGDGLTDTGLDFQVMLDRRQHSSDLATPTYDAINDKTTITLGYDHDAAITKDDVAVVDSTGKELTVDSIGTNTILVYGDHTSTTFWAGEKYTQTVTLSEPVPQREGPRGPILRQGTFRLQTLLVQVEDTGAFAVDVEPAEYGETFTHQFTPQLVGGYGVESGTVSLLSGSYPVGIWAPARNLVVRLYNSSPLPSRFIGLVWNGDLSPYAAV